jgi:hypothetical protein
MAGTDVGSIDADPFRSSMMLRAITNGATARLRSTPNPWVGAVLFYRYGSLYDGATRRPGGRHTEREALEAAGTAAEGATLFTTFGVLQSPRPERVSRNSDGPQNVVDPSERRGRNG